MGVPQYTTPTITLTFADQALDLTRATDVAVTFCSEHSLITKTGSDLSVSEKEIGVDLSQEETARLFVGDVEIQANWIIGEKRFASDIVKISISKQLYEKVM